MKKSKSLYQLTILVVGLLMLSALAGCKAAPTPTPTATPRTTTPTLAASPTLTASPKPTATPTVTPKPTATPALTPPYYQGKTLKIVVPSGAGGGTDIFARFMSYWLPKYLPGNPTVVVVDMPAASGTAGCNYVYNMSRPDGYTALVANAGNNTAVLLGFQGVKYDLANMPIVVGAAGGGTFYYCKAGVISKIDDIYEKPLLVFGSQVISSTPTMLFALAKEILGFKTERIVLGYSGQGDVARAFLAGEINCSGTGITDYITFTQNFVQKGEAVILWQSGSLDPQGNVARKIPDIPMVYDRYLEKYGKQPSGKAWEAFKSYLGGAVAFDKGLLFTPNTPDAIVKIVGDACQKMASDPEFVASAKKTLELEAVTGEALGKMSRVVFAKPDKEVLSWLKTWLHDVYNVE